MLNNNRSTYLNNGATLVIKTANPEKIERVYQMFCDRSEDWSPGVFHDLYFG